MTTRFVWSHGKRIEVETVDLGDLGITPRRLRRHRFVMITKGQANRLMYARRATTLKLFLELLFLSFKVRGKSFQLANVGLNNKHRIGRHQKYRCLLELETLRLIRVCRMHGKSPEILIIPVPDNEGDEDELH
jgi:hypothetical protein